MSRKDYIAIAEAIRLSDTRDELIANLVSVLKRDNGAFNAERFLTAAGVTK